MSLRVLPGGRGEADLPGLLVVGAAEVVTMGGGPRAGAEQGEVDRRTAVAAEGPTSPNDPAVAIWEGRILAVGGLADLEQVLAADGYRLDQFARLDAAGGTVTPGLVDPHTHLLFAGSREGELELRQRGAAYLDILAAGGGILSTVAATRAASADELAAHGRRWLDEMLGHGVTTVEAKSGYGLDLATELRLLEVAHRLGTRGADRGRPDLARRARRSARVPRPSRRHRGVRTPSPRRAAAGNRRPGSRRRGRRLL